MTTRCPKQHKIKYNNSRQAELAIIRLHKSGRFCYGRYQCPGFKHWHITSWYDNRSKWCKDMCDGKGESVKVKEKTQLTPDEIREALKQINNKPASIWLRIKDFIGF